VRSVRNKGGADTQTRTQFAHFAEFTYPQICPNSNGISTSQASHTSLAKGQNLNAGDVEAF